MAPDRVAATLFGAFRLIPAERRLERAGQPVKLGDRALDILIALTRRAGEVVERRDLASQVWPGQTVDDGALRVHMAALRSALGEGRDGARYIANVHGRGYCFVAPVQVDTDREPAAGPETPSDPPPAAPAVPPASGAGALPQPLARVVGRDEVVLDLLAALDGGRFVSLVGPGGIGKTTVAVLAAHAWREAQGAETRFVDLGGLADEALTAGAIAAAMDVTLQGGTDADLTALFRERQMLLVLDSCERVIGAAAAFAEQIMRHCPGVRILATSQEPLRAESEQVYRLPSLPYPEPGQALSTEAALAYPAVRLLVDRAMAAQHAFRLSDEDTDAAAEICQKLDGVALAVELAGGRIGVIGLRETAAQLGGELALRWPGRRTALPRHQTLNAALDWSYAVLDGAEQAVLRRLAVFAGRFSVEAAIAVAGGDGIDPLQAADLLGALVAKSLVAVDPAAGADRFRLLDTARAYCRGKLATSPDAAGAPLRHVRWLAQTWTPHGRASLIPRLDLARFKREAADVREALAWCFAPGGDAGCGALLAAGAAPAMLELAFWDDAERWTAEALDRISETDDPLVRVELLTSHAQALLLLERQGPRIRGDLTEAIALAEQIGDPHYQLRGLLALHRYLCRNEDYAASLEVARRIRVAAGAAGAVEMDVLADLAAGMSHHFLGPQTLACAELRSGLERMAAAEGLQTTLFGHQSDFHAWVCLARSLWLCGLADQAAATARRAIAEAERLRGEGALGVSAIWVIQVHFWTGDLAAAQAMADELLDLTRDHPNAPLRDLGFALRGELLVRRGEPAEGVPLLKRYLDLVRAAGRYSLMPTCAYAEGALALGDVDGAAAALDWAMGQAENTSYRLFRPELLRLRGEVLAAKNETAAAARVFGEAIGAAREAEALAWELRAALSLGRLQRADGRSAEAASAIEALVGRFAEGHWTRDLKAAREMLAAARQPTAR